MQHSNTQSDIIVTLSNKNLSTPLIGPFIQSITTETSISIGKCIFTGRTSSPVYVLEDIDNDS